MVGILTGDGVKTCVCMPNPRLVGRAELVNIMSVDEKMSCAVEEEEEV